jgi:hypothetical protein
MVRLRNKNIETIDNQENIAIVGKRKNDRKEIEKDNIKKHRIDSTNFSTSTTSTTISANEIINQEEEEENDDDDYNDDKIISNILHLNNSDNQINNNSNNNNKLDCQQDNHQYNNLNVINSNKPFQIKKNYQQNIQLSSNLLRNNLIRNKERQEIKKNLNLRLNNNNNINNHHQNRDNIYNYSRLNDNNFIPNRHYYYSEEDIIQDSDPELLLSLDSNHSKNKIYPFYMHFITSALILISMIIIKHITNIYFSPLLPLFLDRCNSYIKEIVDIYNSLKVGDFKYNCVYGGSPFQVAECEIKGGFNRAVMYTTIQLMEFCASLFSVKNIFQSGAVLLGIWQIIKKTVTNIPIFLLFILKFVKSFLIAYYIFLLKLIYYYVQSINDA